MAKNKTGLRQNSQSLTVSTSASFWDCLPQLQFNHAGSMFCPLLPKHTQTPAPSFFPVPIIGVQTVSNVYWLLHCMVAAGKSSDPDQIYSYICSAGKKVGGLHFW